MSMWGRLYESVLFGLAAARRHYNDPSAVQRQEDFASRATYYQLLWAYYENSMFDVVANIGAQYLDNYRLYRQIRGLDNPTRRLVDFYSSHVYPGLLSEDGKSLPDGVPLAIPFSDDTDQGLKSAIAQFWQWSNWQARKAQYVRYGHALGNVLVEVVDDVERGKITADIPWPGHITELDIDGSGNVQAYTLEYQAQDADKTFYRYRKEVDENGFRWYRDDQLFQVSENIYGFVPAVWYKNGETGSMFGTPAIANSLPLVDELNSLISHIHDQIHIKIEAPVMLWGASIPPALLNQQKRTQEEAKYDQEKQTIMTGPAGGRVDSLAGDLDLSAADISIGRLVASIEKNHPELSLYRELRTMSQVTGPAASRLVADASAPLIEAQAAYDQQSIKLFQMVVAIGGYRANTTWGRESPLTKQQQKFLPFDLDSYASGALDMAIMPRPLMAPTRTELAQESTAFWTGIQTAVNAGVPLPIALKEAGWGEEQISELDEAKKQAQVEAQKAMEQQVMIQAKGAQAALPEGKDDEEED